MRAATVAVALCLCLVAGCAQLVPAPVAEPAAEPLHAWSRVLSRFVDDAGRVDYRGLASERGDLDRYVAWIYAVSPASHPALFPTRAHVLAYHLNAYNALAMYNVLDANQPRSLADYGLVRFFWQRRVQVGGERISLYAYENSVIRKLEDARVHFALNCMALGCPRLPRIAFRADELDRQLDREARAFVDHARNVRVEPAGRTLHLSGIFDWYRPDFLREAASLPAWVNRFRSMPVPEDYAVEFIEYDWTVNARE